MLPGKMRYPVFLETVPCAIAVAGKETDPETGRRLEKPIWRGNCIWNESEKRIITADKTVVTLSGAAMIQGSAALFLSPFYGGHFTVYPGTEKARRMLIHGVKRAANPDGSIHHITLELI